MVLVGTVGCNDKAKREQEESASRPAPPLPSQRPLQLQTDTPRDGTDPSHTVDLSGQTQAKPWGVALGPAQAAACPKEMVSVGGRFCIDRYETSLVDRDTHRPLSPHYPPHPDKVGELLAFWTRSAPLSPRALGRDLPIPEPPAFQLTETFHPAARSVEGVLPSGYLSQRSAELSCKAAGKRLCSRVEWVTACRGQDGRRYPYGDDYRHGVCNVHRDHHPAALLHGNSSKNHTDPRLGLTADDAGPLLRATGSTPECSSQWGADAIYDMVGNLDEWVSDPEAVFLGGFFSRATRDGCESFIDTHAPSYYDYSLGTRCCLDP